MLPTWSVLSCLVMPGAFAPSALVLRGDGERESLEEFLARARAQRELAQGRLRDQVLVLVRRVEELPLPPPREVRDAWIEEVVALGAEAAPLFVAWIDPGEVALEKERFRSSQVAFALCRVDIQAITSELLRVAQQGTLEGRRNAVRILETSREPARVRPALLALFQSSEGALQQAALRALIQFGGPENDALLGEVLESTDEALVDLALAALTDAKNARAADKVRKLLSDPARAAAHIEALLLFYRALPELVRDAEVRELVLLAGQAEVPRSRREAIVDALPLFVTAMTPELRKNLDPLLSSTERKVREGALVLLSILGDKNAKRDLLKDYDTTVESNPAWSPAYARRGDVFRRVHDYDNAIRDYLKALKVGEDDPTPQPDTYIGLARCYAIRKKLKEASSYLQRAPIPLSQLKALADDPDFAEVRAHPKYGEVFPRR